MGNNHRLVATVLIWIAFMLVSIAGMSFHLKDEMLAWVTISSALAAAYSTRAIWRSAGSPSEAEIEKSKRRTRIERVIDNLDERDLSELRARLIGDSDGEVSSLDELIRR